MEKEIFGGLVECQIFTNRKCEMDLPLPHIIYNNLYLLLCHVGKPYEII